MVEYYENSAISQSQLKLLLSSPQLFNTITEPEMFFEEKKHFIIGSAVDCMLTQPLGTFEEKYHVSNLVNKPTDVVKSIVNQVYSIVNQPDLTPGRISEYPSTILDVCIEHRYYPNLNNETRVAKICEAWEYWEDLKNAEGKQVLSQTENDLISNITMSLRTNIATAKYFHSDVILYQHPIYFEYEGVRCKALLDMIVIDYENKTIQPIDIKTLGDYTINFPKSLRQRRYDIQAAFYTEALKYWIESSTPYYGFKILPFKFLVESTTYPGNPLVYVCDDTLLDIGKNGWKECYTKATIFNLAERTTKEDYVARIEEVKGFHQLIELYNYYTNYGFDIDKRVRERNFELTIDWSGII